MPPDPAAYRCCQATPGAWACIGITSTSKEVQNRKRLAEMEIDCAQVPSRLGQQDDDVVGPSGVVARQVLSLQVGVHGHLGASASANGRYEVYGRLAAATLD